MAINRTTQAKIWPRFDEQNYLEFCPSVVTLPNGEHWVAFRRNKRPPVWGAGEIWIVKADQDLQPVGEPFQLIQEGEDPRLLLVGNRLFLFYVHVERNSNKNIVGTTIALAEMSWQRNFELIHHVILPKNPLGNDKKPDNSMQSYEKNWVPFFIDLNTIGILYSHSPWIVLELSITGTPKNWSLGTVHQGQGIQWGYGEIRGGSVPIPYEDQEYITFFHSSAVTGGKKIYYGGACIFSQHPPYSPRYFTPLPLTTSPFKSGSDQHGWYLGQPIIFPLGVAFNTKQQNYDILCSLDDAFICLYSVPETYLRERLQSVENEPETLRRISHRKTAPEDRDLFIRTKKSQIAFQDDLIRFFNAMEIEGDLYIDIGADDGVLLTALNNRFSQSIAVTLTDSAQAMREHNAEINQLKNLTFLNLEGLKTIVSPLAEEIAAGSHSAWIHFDFSQPDADLHTCIPFALQIKASMLFSNISQQAMQIIYEHYKMAGYTVSAISPDNQAVYLFIAEEQISKYHWFI